VQFPIEVDHLVRAGSQNGIAEQANGLNTHESAPTVLVMSGPTSRTV
jgi:hypothetical protein